ncbi:hypothetical protein LTR53_006829 [Teratosphaeriaceae sp. CCFEE 6253]|nr:hypothetical protein LTR53_006829 [Teratosphaeriaceae sp. CCFEE 6253]
MGAEAHQLTRIRWAMMDAWRPIAPVTRDNLGLADARSIADDRLVETMMLFRSTDQIGENPVNSAIQGLIANHTERAYGLDMNNAAWELLPPGPKDMYRWYYASGMQPDEAMLLKIFDSSTREDVAKRIPHSSFESEDDRGPARQSLEGRSTTVHE